MSPEEVAHERAAWQRAADGDMHWSRGSLGARTRAHTPRVQRLDFILVAWE